MPDTDLGVPGAPQSQNTMDHPHVLSGTRVVETLQLYPAYVIPLAALTAAFLVVELAFAARLLDAVGGPISERQLTELAVWGWGLSGVALTLLVWGSFLLPRSYRSEWSARRNRVVFVLSAIVCWETVYLVGPALTRTSGGSGDRIERQCAVQLRVLAMARQDSADDNHAARHPLGPRRCAVRGPVLRQPAGRFARRTPRSAARHGGTTNRHRRAGLRQRLHSLGPFPEGRLQRLRRGTAPAGGRYSRNSRSAGAGLATLPGPARAGRPVAHA